MYVGEFQQVIYWESLMWYDQGLKSQWYYQLEVTVILRYRALEHTANSNHNIPLAANSTRKVSLGSNARQSIWCASRSSYDYALPVCFRGVAACPLGCDNVVLRVLLYGVYCIYICFYICFNVFFVYLFIMGFCFATVAVVYVMVQKYFH